MNQTAGAPSPLPFPHLNRPLTLGNMSDRLENLADDQILTLQEAAALLGLEPLTLETLALRKAYGLKSRMNKAKRSFVVSDLRAFLIARQQTAS